MNDEAAKAIIELVEEFSMWSYEAYNDAYLGDCIVSDYTALELTKYLTLKKVIIEWQRLFSKHIDPVLPQKEKQS